MTARHSRLWAGEPFVCLAGTHNGQSLGSPDILRFPRRSALQHPSWKLIDTNYMPGSRPGSPGAGSHSIVVNLEPAAARAR
jgi:hypothetical protein